MAYDTVLAERIRAHVKTRPGFSEKQMFGGVGFLLHGNMCVGAWKESLILRLGDAAKGALRERPVREFDITGRPMKGWVLVEPSGTSRDDNLRRWVELAVAHVATLPAKDVATKKQGPVSQRTTKRRR